MSSPLTLGLVILYLQNICLVDCTCLTMYMLEISFYVCSLSVDYNWCALHSSSMYSIITLFPFSSTFVEISGLGENSIFNYAAVLCSVTQSCPTLCDPVAYQSSLSRGFPKQMLEWVAISFFRGSSQPKDWAHVFCTAGVFFSVGPPEKQF